MSETREERIVRLSALVKAYNADPVRGAEREAEERRALHLKLIGPPSFADCLPPRAKNHLKDRLEGYRDATSEADLARIVALHNAAWWHEDSYNFGRSGFRALCDFCIKHGYTIPGGEEWFRRPISILKRMAWLESKHTLHCGVAILYVVDGYDIQLTRDDEPVGEIYHGDTLADAILAAMRAEEQEQTNG